MNATIPVTVLGATGTVGQRFVRRLVRHPLFHIEHLAASERSAGKTYAEACEWRLGGEPYGGLASKRLVAADPARAMAPIVFSALDSGPAREIEPQFAAAGANVFSNASAFRMEPDVPLLVPEVNPSHLDILRLQRERRGYTGSISTNPNCTTTILVMALAPLHTRFGVEALVMSSLQAVSGAGYPGVPSLDILGNVIPHIAGEEEKVEIESKKLLGSFGNQGAELAEFAASATCHRVPVLEGHTLAVSVRLRGAPSPADVRETLAQWRGNAREWTLPSAPARPLVLHEAPNRPQPRLDVEECEGMAVHVGRIRACPLLGIKFTVLGHNTERGAAGGSLLNAELALARGSLQR